MFYSIGYQSLTLENLSLIIESWEIDKILDVRSFPTSRWNHEFDKKRLVDAFGKRYCWKGKLLGGKFGPVSPGGIDYLCSLSGKKSYLLLCLGANPNQPRKQFDQGALEELAESIKQYGILEPIVLKPRDGQFMIVAGERRFLAPKLAGLSEIPARIIEASDELVEELALLENVQRQDLNAIEEAKAYRALLDRG